MRWATHASTENEEYAASPPVHTLETNDYAGPASAFSYREQEPVTAPEFLLGWIPAKASRIFDASGNLREDRRRSYCWSDSGGGHFLLETLTQLCENRHDARYFYGPDQKLRVAQTNRDYLDEFGNPRDAWGTYEEYWYDALGRRVLKRVRQESPHCDPSLGWCESPMERYVWDGDQLLSELRSTSLNDPAPSSRIVYTHGPGIDAPLDLVRSGTPVMLHQDWRGLYAFGTTPQGARYLAGIEWPAGSWPAWL